MAELEKLVAADLSGIHTMGGCCSKTPVVESSRRHRQQQQQQQQQKAAQARTEINGKEKEARNANGVREQQQQQPATKRPETEKKRTPERKQSRITAGNLKNNQSHSQPLGKRTNFGYERDFKEKYILGKLLGHGQFGYTYVATEKSTGIKVAAKCIEKKQVLTEVIVLFLVMLDRQGFPMRFRKTRMPISVSVMFLFDPISDE